MYVSHICLFACMSISFTLLFLQNCALLNKMASNFFQNLSYHTLQYRKKQLYPRIRKLFLLLIK
jgi:hypothetical protein